MNTKNEFKTWWIYTSCAVGSVTLALLIVFSIKLSFFTFLCYAADKKCERAWGHTDFFEEFIGNMVMNNPGVDVTLTPQTTPTPKPVKTVKPIATTLNK